MYRRAISSHTMHWTVSRYIAEQISSHTTHRVIFRYIGEGISSHTMHRVISRYITERISSHTCTQSNHLSAKYLDTRPKAYMCAKVGPKRPHTYHIHLFL